MIEKALRFALGRLNDYIGVTPPEVVAGSVPDQNQPQSVSHVHLSNKIIASVVNFREDHTYANLKPASASRPGVMAFTGYASSTPRLQILVLFSANQSPEQYDQALLRISQVVDFFRKDPVFTADIYPDLRLAGIGKLYFHFQQVSFEELHHIWSINGGRYRPSVLYNMQIDLNDTGYAV